MTREIRIGDRRVGPGCSTYVVAELSANHGQSYEQAARLVHAAKQAGADAVKLQTYTADTMTIASDRDCFRIRGGTIWDGRSLHSLYQEAYTPWEWQPKLKDLAESLGMDLFSTPFDESAVDFLQAMEVPAFKIASFELVDLPLIERVARTGKPMILSTGMATLAEIAEAVEAFRTAGGRELALLKCTSAYPAAPSEMNLRTISHLSEAFDVPVGISDHTLSAAVPVAAVALGACIVEKHLTLSRDSPGPDSAFSLEPQEFAAMVEAIRTAEQALGKVYYGLTAQEGACRAFRRSLFVVREMRAGEPFDAQNVRAIRPGPGLPPKYLRQVLGRRAVVDIPAGTPLSWDLVGKRDEEHASKNQSRAA